MLYAIPESIFISILHRNEIVQLCLKFSLIDDRSKCVLWSFSLQAHWHLNDCPTPPRSLQRTSLSLVRASVILGSCIYVKVICMLEQNCWQWPPWILWLWHGLRIVRSSSVPEALVVYIRSFRFIPYWPSFCASGKMSCVTNLKLWYAYIISTQLMCRGINQMWGWMVPVECENWLV
jgi:hypothetical protein